MVSISTQESFSELKSMSALNELKKTVTTKGIALLIWAEWHPPCHVLKSMLEEMAKLYTNLVFTWVRSISCLCSGGIVQC